jgi:hypothetical protein
VATGFAGQARRMRDRTRAFPAHGCPIDDRRDGVSRTFADVDVATDQ